MALNLGHPRGVACSTGTPRIPSKNLEIWTLEIYYLPVKRIIRKEGQNSKNLTNRP